MAYRHKSNNIYTTRSRDTAYTTRQTLHINTETSMQTNNLAAEMSYSLFKLCNTHSSNHTLFTILLGDRGFPLLTVTLSHALPKHNHLITPAHKSTSNGGASRNTSHYPTSSLVNNFGCGSPTSSFVKSHTPTLLKNHSPTHHSPARHHIINFTQPNLYN